MGSYSQFQALSREMAISLASYASGDPKPQSIVVHLGRSKHSFLTWHVISFSVLSDVSSSWIFDFFLTCSFALGWK